jgi:O-antigen/teichoic acid export membrane protein
VRIDRPSRLVAYRAASDIVAKGAFFVLTIAAARRLPQSDFGLFAIGSTLGWMAGLVSDAGLQVHLAREVARRVDRAGELLDRWLPIRMAGAAAALGVAALALPLSGSTLQNGLPLFLLVVAYGAGALVEFLNYFFRGLSRTDIESTLTLVQRLTTVALGLLALAWRPGLMLLAAAMVLPMVAAFLASVRIARRLTGSAGGQPNAVGDRRIPVVIPTPRRDRFDEWRRDVLPLGAAAVLSAAYFRIDVFLVELWRGSEAVGMYSAVFRLVEAMRLFPAAVLAVVLPSLFRATTRRPLVSLAARLTIAAAVAVVPLWLMAGWLVPFVYGPSYAGAVPAFRILLLSFPLMSLNYALTHQLVGWNRHRAYAWICAASLAFNVALNARLIPRLSIDGAAWSTLWTELLLGGGCLLALAAGAPAARSDAQNRDAGGAAGPPLPAS